MARQVPNNKWLVVRNPLSTAHGIILTVDVVSRPIIQGGHFGDQSRSTDFGGSIMRRENTQSIAAQKQRCG